MHAGSNAMNFVANGAWLIPKQYPPTKRAILISETLQVKYFAAGLSL